MPTKYQYALPEHAVSYGVSVPAEDLKIDPQAQRTLNERRAQKLAEEFIPTAIGELIISERADGDRFIIDGQHRWRAAQLVGIATVQCEIHHGLTQTEEAVLFLIKNRESSRPAAFDEYTIGLTGGIPLFVDTEKVLQAHELKIGSTGPNTVGAVNGILRITDSYGPEVLDRVLTVAEAAWGRTQETWDGMILGGLGMLLGRHGEQVKDPDLVKRLAKAGPAYRWKGDVIAASTGAGTRHSGTGGRSSAAYRMFVETWNKGRRSEATRIHV
jgi:hypothetical protein